MLADLRGKDAAPIGVGTVVAPIPPLNWGKENAMRSIWNAGPIAVLGCAVLVSCTSKLDGTVGTSNSGLTCDNFRTSGQIDADVDAKVKVFLQATQEFKNVSADVRGTV